MPTYSDIPGVDENFNFPPEVQSAILNLFKTSDSAFHPDGVNVLAIAPPSGQVKIVADGNANDAAALNALLAYVKTTYGGGRLILPAGKTIKLNSTITIPAKVQLYWPESTTLDFRNLGASTAIVVNDNIFTPIVGGGMIGPNTGDQNNFSTTASVGLSITGHNLNFEKVNISRFNIGVDLVHSNTYILSFTQGSIVNCGICLDMDLNGQFDGRTQSVTNSGERINFRDWVFANSKVIFYASSSGVEFFFDGCSLDYSGWYGSISDSHIFMNNCHLESKAVDASSADWGTPIYFLFRLVNSARLYMTNCNAIFSGTGILHMIDPYNGPSNYGNGIVMYNNCTAYFKPSGTDAAFQDFSRKLINLGPAGTTTKTVKSFFLSKWNQVTVRYTSTDGYAEPPSGTGKPSIASANMVDGTVTINCPATASSPTWVELIN